MKTAIFTVVLALAVFAVLSFGWEANEKALSEEFTELIHEKEAASETEARECRYFWGECHDHMPCCDWLVCRYKWPITYNICVWSRTFPEK
uniref:U7-theraphotoxin-Hhn1c n=1 Tax=Cyriopagopus hainanus TaxID=2781057 RepID=H13C1_CYRHA|nr:RecName: Full=U7-theraphotoxin-Hhn1c; Short=U7-TRTX-Hhn1c; AltName: Full=Hainantoxin-XIII-3; Short=HNTX-XIII-3; Flags: Precursor [Haplopelma hainanum]ADB56797.1 HNTX-XIII-3 precursor [Haplopelma hainanum]